MDGILLPNASTFSTARMMIVGPEPHRRLPQQFRCSFVVMAIGRLVEWSILTRIGGNSSRVYEEMCVL